MDAALFELLLFFGVVLGLAGWELYSVNRSLRRPADSANDPTDETECGHDHPQE